MRRSALCADRVRAKELCHAYNQLRPSDAAGMRELLRRLLGKTGETFCVTAPFWCDYGYNIRLGEHFYANHNLVILDCAASGGWSMLTQSPWAIMCGSAAASSSKTFRAIRSLSAIRAGSFGRSRRRTNRPAGTDSARLHGKRNAGRKSKCGGQTK